MTIRGFRASGRGKEPVTNPVTVGDSGDSIAAILTRLTQTKASVNADVAALYAAQGNAQRVKLAKQRAVTFHDQHYLNGLERMCALPRGDLAAYLVDLEARQERGWELDGDAVAETFVRVTLEIEVLTDALDGVADTRQRHRERVEHVARLVAT